VKTCLRIVPAWETASIDEIRDFCLANTKGGALGAGFVQGASESFLRRVAELSGAEFVKWLAEDRIRNRQNTAEEIRDALMNDLGPSAKVYIQEE
jgi:hypothetical protein